ncbi:MAG TPA: dihydroxyacetone kinase phosphoryl donor subunit DhaM [Rugosimonospora sp.]|nr:dihydroxyacetone kinase phosphoryl donor subunit DhaM [Rugosimonospora sp.]
MAEPVGAKPVGIVLVSHSESLAAGLRDLLLQVSGPDVTVADAGGTADGRLGTSDERIRAAIGRADTGGGVVVLTDLGSAVLTTLAVLAEPAREDVVLVDAPFVEGAVAAAVTASTGADLATVVAAAEEARSVPKF